MARSTFGILSPKPGLAHQSSAHHRPGFFFQQSHRIVANFSRDAKRLVDPKALEFEINAEQNLLDLTEELSGKTCRPSPSFCFIAKNDKHREVFAADFRDSLRRQASDIVKTTDKKRTIVFAPKRNLELFSTVNSYLGLFSHASCTRLVRAILSDHPFLLDLFYFRDRKAVRCWKLHFRPKNLFTQYQFFSRRFRGLIVFQVGCFLELYNRDAVWANKKRYQCLIAFRIQTSMR